MAQGTGDPCSGPLKPQRAKRLILEILKSGVTTASPHALDEMAKDDLSMVDCVNVLRAGVVEVPELERSSWRYRVRTPQIFVVVAFRSMTEIVIVTAWRVKR